MSGPIHPENRMLPGVAINVERPVLSEPPRLQEADPEWRYMDPAGHLHTWVRSSDGWTTPTLKRIIDSPASDEWPAITHLECRACRQIPKRRRPSVKARTVKPKTRSTWGQPILGAPTATVRLTETGREFTMSETELRDLLDAARAWAACFLEDHPEREIHGHLEMTREGPIYNGVLITSAELAALGARRGGRVDIENGTVDFPPLDGSTSGD